MTKQNSKPSLFKVLGKLASGAASSAPAPMNNVLNSAASTSEVLGQVETCANLLKTLLEDED